MLLADAPVGIAMSAVEAAREAGSGRSTTQYRMRSVDSTKPDKPPPSCGLEPAPDGCEPVRFGACETLRKMVDLFLRARSARPERERAWWGDLSISLAEACRRAMFALEKNGVRDGHQWPLSVRDLEAMGARLAEVAPELKAAATFRESYARVEAALDLGLNRKPLLVYDVALRLGYRFGRAPEEIYLHAGARKGANALRSGLGRPRSRPLADFPTSIRTRLTPAQAEDFLCLAAKHLHPGLWD